MTNPAGAPRRKDAIATRERLVRAALDLFTSRTYRGTTTLDIAERARIAEATIYRHFVGKEALFNEAYRQALKWGAGIVRQRDGERLSTADRLTKIARILIEQVPRDSALVIMLLRRHDGAVLEEATVQAGRDFREGLTQLVATGKQEGVIRPGSAELWGSVWLALVGFVVERVAAKEWGPEHPSVGATLDAAWAAIAYRPGDPGL
jgi:AcrR family transcriptional regulator